MATLKDQIDGVCKELKVTVKEGGLIAQVKAAAELCGLEYTRQMPERRAAPVHLR